MPMAVTPVGRTIARVKRARRFKRSMSKRKKRTAFACFETRSGIESHF